MYIPLSLPYINLTLSFWGSGCDENTITEILQVESNDSEAKAINGGWNFSIGNVKSNTATPLFDIITSLFPKYLYQAINNIKKENNLKSELTLTIRTEERLPYICFTDDMIQFMQQTGTVFRLKILFDKHNKNSNAERKARFKIIVKGNDLDFESVTSVLQLAPTFKRRKNEFPVRAIMSGLMRDTWMYETEYYDLKEIKDAFLSFTNILYIRQSALSALQKVQHCAIHIDIVLYIIENGAPFELTLPQELFDIMAIKKIPIAFDMY